MLGRVAVHRVRGAIGFIALAALILPVTESWSTTEINLKRWQRLQTAGRVAPDRGQDDAHRQLLVALPASGRIGFRNVGSGDSGRLLFFLQYSLAPRLIVEPGEHEFVIETGPATSPASLTRDSRFSQTASPNEDLRLFRRVSS
jgi:hypothetical protein